MGTSKAWETEHVHCPAQRGLGFPVHCPLSPPDPSAPPSTRRHPEPNRPHGSQTKSYTILSMHDRAYTGTGCPSIHDDQLQNCHCTS
eukprot:3937053-Rhodomonas_salina.1